MDLFQIVFLYVLLLTFPILIFLIYLSTNKNINFKSKEMYFKLALITSFFLTYRYGVASPKILPVIVLNSIIILSYLKNFYILANVFSILLLILYCNSFNNIFDLLITYIIVGILYIIKRKKNMSNILFVEIFIFVSCTVYVLWLYFFNNLYFDISKIVLVIISYFFISNILCLMYETGKSILKTHLTFKDLQQEKQIRLSLFKITHEIKNPIAVCKGYLDMLNTNNKDQVERYIPIIKSEIERLLSLLQDYLLINKSSMDLDIMDFNMLIDDAVYKLKPILEEKNINLNLDIVDNEIFINGDYNRLSQVMINLIKNSIESMRKGILGKINITTKIKNNNYVVIVEDNGEGMSKEVLSKIKEPFFTTKNRGSGLGVSLIYEIVEAHKGKIEYESELGKGTKVTLLIPLYE